MIKKAFTIIALLLVTAFTYPVRADVVNHNINNTSAVSSTVLDIVSKATVYIKGFNDGVGTGWCFKTSATKSYIMTCDHVVEGTDEKMVVWLYGKGWTSPRMVRVEKRDSKHDMAIISIPGGMESSVKIVDQVKRGQEVFMTGNPLRLPFISFFGNMSSDKLFDIEFPQYLVDIPALPGFSGSAVCNTDGEVVAMLRAVFLYNGAPTHLSLAVPGETLRKFAEDNVK